MGEPAAAAAAEQGLERRHALEQEALVIRVVQEQLQVAQPIPLFLKV